MYINEDELEASGLDRKRVESIARRISRAAKEAAEMGIIVFGGSSGELRYRDSDNAGALILTELKGNFDGGCGASDNTHDGLLRGEHHSS